MSGRKSNLLHFKNIDAQSMAASITSTITSTLNLDNIGLEVVWSSGSTPVGTHTDQVSSDYAQDYQGNVTTTGTWSTLVIAPALAVSGSSGSYYISLPEVVAPWLKVVYTRSSGSGTLNGWITGKMI